MTTTDLANLGLIDANGLTSWNIKGYADAQKNSSKSSETTTGQAARPTPALPPAAPDYSGLYSLQNEVRRKAAIKDAMSKYDALAASTKAAGFQAASNAGTTYANRLMQSGQNPIASGVVAAQARLPVYNSLAEINTDRAKTQLDATSKADSLSAQIASTIAGLQLNYSKTLADFNMQQTGYDLDLNKFNAGMQTKTQEDEFDQRYKTAALLASQRASGGAGTGGNGNVMGMTSNALDRTGYVTNSGALQPAYINGVRQDNKVLGGGGAAMGGVFSINSPSYTQSASDYNRQRDLLQINQNNLW